MSWETSLTSAETEWLSTTSGGGEVATGVQGSYCGAGTPESKVERGASPPCACAVVPACRFLSAPSSGRLWGSSGRWHLDSSGPSNSQRGGESTDQALQCGGSAFPDSIHPSWRPGSRVLAASSPCATGSTQDTCDSGGRVSVVGGQTQGAKP